MDYISQAIRKFSNAKRKDALSNGIWSRNKVGKRVEYTRVTGETIIKDNRGYWGIPGSKWWYNSVAAAMSAIDYNYSKEV